MTPEELARLGWSVETTDVPDGWTVEEPAPSGPHSTTIPTTTLTVGSTAAPTSGQATREDYVAVEPPPPERAPPREHVPGEATSGAMADRAFRGLTMGWGPKIAARIEGWGQQAGLITPAGERVGGDWGTLDESGHVRPSTGRGPESYDRIYQRYQDDQQHAASRAAEEDGVYGQIMPEIADAAGAIPTFLIPSPAPAATAWGQAGQLAAMTGGYGAVRAAGETADALTPRGARDIAEGTAGGINAGLGLGALAHGSGAIADRVARPSTTPETPAQRTMRETIADPQRVRAQGAQKRDLELDAQRLDQAPVRDGQVWHPEGLEADPRHVEELADEGDVRALPDVRTARRLPPPADERHVRSDLLDAMEQPRNGETQREVALPQAPIEPELADVTREDVMLPEYATHPGPVTSTSPEEQFAVSRRLTEAPTQPSGAPWRTVVNFEEPEVNTADTAGRRSPRGTRPIDIARDSEDRTWEADGPMTAADYVRELPTPNAQEREAGERGRQLFDRIQAERRHNAGLADTHPAELPDTQLDTVMPVDVQRPDARIARMGQVPGQGGRLAPITWGTPQTGPYRSAPPAEQPMREPPPGPQQPRGTFVNETADSIRRHDVQGLGRSAHAQGVLAQSAANDAGERMGASLDALSAARGGPVLTPEEAIRAVLGSNEIREALSSHIGAQRAPFQLRLDELRQMLDENGGLTPSSFRKVVLRELSIAAKYDRRALAPPPGSIESARAVRAALVNAGDVAMQRYGAPDAAREYRRARVDYGTMQHASDLADQRTAGNAASHLIPLGAAIATETGAALGHGGTIPSILGAGGAGAAAFGLQREGPQLLARAGEGLAGMTPGNTRGRPGSVGIPGAEAAGRTLRTIGSQPSNPAATTSIGRALARMLQAANGGDEQAAAAHFAASQTDPWYQSAAQEQHE